MPKLNLSLVEKDVEDYKASEQLEVKPIFTKNFRDECAIVAKAMGKNLDWLMKELTNIVNEGVLEELWLMDGGIKGHFSVPRDLEHFSVGVFHGYTDYVEISAKSIKNWKEFFDFRMEQNKGEL